MIKYLGKNDDKLEINQSYLQLGKFFPPDWGGIETVTFNLLMGLTEKSITNATIVFGDSNSIESISCGTDTANVYRAKHVLLFGAPLSIKYLLMFNKFSGSYDVAIIHLPNPFAALSLAFSGYKGKVVLYWHSDIVNKGLLGWLLAPLERWLISRADVVIAPTKAHLEFSRYASELTPKGKIVPYPVDSRLLAVAEKHRMYPRSLSEKKEIRILAIGRLVKYKGLEYLVRAITYLQPKYTIHVDILGDGPLKQHLDSLVTQLGLQKIVNLHGQVSEDERERFLIEADIFCFPSITKQEMYGMVQYEAMAYGVPIISTDIVGSGSPELTRMTGAGIVVAPYESLEIAKAIQSLIDDATLYSVLSRNGINAICETFNPSTLINEFCMHCRT